MRKTACVLFKKMLTLAFSKQSAVNIRHSDMKLFFSTLTTSFLMLGSAIAATPTVSAVDSHSCSKLKGSDKPFILALKKGDNIIEAITQCANEAQLAGASLSGVGALENPTLTYYNISTKKYQDKTFPGIYELISVNGNVTQSQGKREVHLHVALSDDQYHMIGGHLGNALVGAVAEITVTPFKGSLVKKLDKQTGLEVISS